MRTTAIVLAILILAFAIPVFATVPPIINYQGKLMQPSGAPVPDGTYSVQFTIYAAPIGGAPLWSETNDTVQVKGGLFAVLLGSINNLGPNIFDQPNRFFGVKVGSDPEMTPRQQIASVAYAVKAGSADQAGNGVPAGGVIMWSGAANQIPQGWALCNGQNGTPDLRNRFLVGAGDEYAVGGTGGEKLHQLTVAEMPSHRHAMIVRNNNGYTGPDGQVAGSGIVGPTHDTGDETASAGGDQPHENRPPYYALCFIMKLGY